MKSTIISVIAGYVVWTVLWLGGNALLFSAAAQRAAAGEAVTDVAMLLPILLWSVVCSLAAGFAVGRLDKSEARRSAIIAGSLLLLTGIGVQASVWTMMPLWYHLAFLVLIVPVLIMGCRLAASGKVAQ